MEKHLAGQHDQLKHAGEDFGSRVKDAAYKVKEITDSKGFTVGIGAASIAIQLYLIGGMLYSGLDTKNTIEKQMNRAGKFRKTVGALDVHADREEDIKKLESALDSMLPSIKNFTTNVGKSVYLSSRPFSFVGGFVPIIKETKKGDPSRLWMNTDFKKTFGFAAPMGIGPFESQNRMMQSILAHETAHAVWAGADEGKRESFRKASGFWEKARLFNYPGTIGNRDQLANEIFGHMTGECAITPKKVRSRYNKNMISAWEDLTGMKLDDLITESGYKKSSVSAFDDDTVISVLDGMGNRYYIPFSAIEERLKTKATVENIVKHLAGQHDQKTHAANRPGTSYVDTIRLSKTEKDILQGLVLFESTEDVADALGIDKDTIGTRLGRIYGLIGVDNKVGATVWALDKGVINLADIPFSRQVLADRPTDTQLQILRDLASQRTQKKTLAELRLTRKEYSEELQKIKENWGLSNAEPQQLVVAAIRGGHLDLDQILQIRKEDIAAGASRNRYVQVEGRRHRLGRTEQKVLNDLMTADFSDETMESHRVTDYESAYRTKLYSKLNATNPANLAIKAVKSGLIDVEKIPSLTRRPKLTPTEKYILGEIASGEYEKRLGKDVVRGAPIYVRRIKDKFRDDNLARVAVQAWLEGMIDVMD